MKVLSTVTRPISPAEAAELAVLFYEGVQRNIRSLVVASYLEEMRSGRWGVSEDMVIVGTCSTGRILIAGNHRMRALALHSEPVLMTIQEREYDSDEEMRQDYIKTNGGSTFTTADRLKAMEVPERLGLSPKWTSASVSALKLIASGFNGGSRTGLSDNFFIQSLPNWEAQVRAYYASTHGCYHKEDYMAQRASVVAVGLITFRFQPALATRFWKRVWDNDGLRKGEPEWALRTFLTNSKALTGGQGQGAYAASVSYAWNAAFEGREIKYVKSLEDWDLVIKGTPLVSGFREHRALVEGGKG